MHLKKFGAAAAMGAALLVLAPRADAAIITYSSRAAFLAAAGATTLVDFEAQNPNGANGYQHWNTLTVGDVTFAQPENRLFVFGHSFYPTPGLTSDYLNQNCCAPSGINVTFANGVYAVGMEIGIQNNWNGSGPVTFSLSTGDTFSVTAPLLWGSNTPMMFFGFTSDTAITSFNMNSPSQGIAVDDFTYGSAVVPEPGSLVLLGSGLFAAAGAMKRRARERRG